MELGDFSEIGFPPTPEDYGVFDSDEDIIKADPFICGQNDGPWSPSSEEDVEVSSDGFDDWQADEEFRCPGLTWTEKSPPPSENVSDTEEELPQQKYFNVVVSDPNVTCVRIFSEKKLPTEHFFTMF